jgi:ParB-like chromosome segregation protein Spo0J
VPFPQASAPRAEVVFSHSGGADPRLDHNYKPPTDGMHKRLHPIEILRNPANPRTNVGSLDDLDSIATDGIVTALAVVPRETYEREYPEHVEKLKELDKQNLFEMTEPDDGRDYRPGSFVLIAGERRWTKVKQLLWAAEESATAVAADVDLTRLPVIVHTKKDRKALDRFGLQENGGRKDLPPMDEARAIFAYKQRYGLKTDTELARELGLPNSVITKRAALLKMPPEVQAMVGYGDGQIGPETAYKLRLAGSRILEAWEVMKEQGRSAEWAVQYVLGRHKQPESGPVVSRPAARTAAPQTTVEARRSEPTAAVEPQGASGPAAIQVPSPPMDAKQRLEVRRDEAAVLLRKGLLKVKEIAEMLGRFAVDGVRLDADGEAVRIAGEWLNRDPLKSQPGTQMMHAGLALMFAAAEVRVTQGHLTRREGFYLSVLRDWGQYLPSEQEEAAIEMSAEARA